jgi:putative effector of murein hydrolase LrgA (UPF0299 family)
MKFIMLVLTFLIGHMLFFFIFSLIGLLWNHSYVEIIRDGPWFLAYTLFIGIWVGVLVARSYYLMHERYFNRLF